LSETLDQLGGFATTVAAAADLCSVMADSDLRPRSPGRPPHFGVYRSPEWPELQPAAMDNFDLTINRLRPAGATIEEAAAPPGFDSAHPVQRNIMVFEAARNLGPDVARAPELVSDTFRRTIANGERLPEADYRAALGERERLIEAVAEWAGRFDGILCPPTLGEAPGLATTGDPRPCFRWTLVGSPAGALPSRTRPGGAAAGPADLRGPGLGSGAGRRGRLGGGGPSRRVGPAITPRGAGPASWATFDGRPEPFVARQRCGRKPGREIWRSGGPGPRSRRAPDSKGLLTQCVPQTSTPAQRTRISCLYRSRKALFQE